MDYEIVDKQGNVIVERDGWDFVFPKFWELRLVQGRDDLIIRRVG